MTTEIKKNTIVVQHHGNADGMLGWGFAALRGLGAAVEQDPCTLRATFPYAWTVTASDGVVAVRQPESDRDAARLDWDAQRGRPRPTLIVKTFDDGPHGEMWRAYTVDDRYDLGPDDVTVMPETLHRFLARPAEPSSAAAPQRPCVGLRWSIRLRAWAVVTVPLPAATPVHYISTEYVPDSLLGAYVRELAAHGVDVEFSRFKPAAE